jgi:hypothetical protein
LRALAFVAVGCALVAVGLVLTRDPEEAWAVALVIAALGVGAGAVATMLQLRAPRVGGRRRPSAVRRGVAARRGVGVALVVSLLLWLRAVDGLSLITAGFVVGAFLAAELVLSALPTSSR